MFKTYESNVKKKKLFFGKISLDTLQTEPGLSSIPNYTNIFVSKWVTTTNNETIQLPYESNGFYNGTIDWGDGEIVSNEYTNRTHVFKKPGTYQIEISGNVIGFKFNNTGDKNKIIEIINWGKLKGLNNSNENMFRGCSNLKLNNVLDSLNLLGITSMSAMFKSCTSLTTINNINNWDTSSILNLSIMFEESTNFNQDIGNWNVSGVTNMQAMFRQATSFNQDLNNWDVSNVTNMFAMFFNATMFNQYLGDWDVSNVSSMSFMLNNSGLNVLNYSNTLIGWASLPTRQSSVTLGASGLIYSDYAKYARDILTGVSNWTISQDARAPFIAVWRTTTTNEQIQLPYSPTGTYSGTIDWGDGQTSNNLYASGIHSYSTPGDYTIKISGDVTGFKFSTLTTAQKNKIVEIKQWGPLRGLNNLNSNMFYECSNLVINQVSDIINFSGVTTTVNMFYGCGSITTIKNLESWNTETINNMQSMFFNALNFNQNLATWNVSGVTIMQQMLTNTKLNLENYSNTLIGWSSLPSLQSNVQLGANNLYYRNEAISARNILTNTYNWNITDSGLV